MIIYYLLFLIPAFFSIKNNPKYNNKILWLVVGLFYSIVIGLRHNVGADWGAYVNHYLRMQYYTFEEVITGEDPGYYALNYLMYYLDLGIYWVNFICAVIFMIGLIKFAKREPNPWMVLAVAVPYTLIVVSMGYTRQAVALGLVMWAITYLNERKMLGFIILVTLAATFHKSAVLMIGLGIFASGSGKFLKIIAVGTIGIGLYNVFLAPHTDELVKNYVDAQMQSSGAYIRTFMNLIPAMLLVLFRKRWKEYFDDFTFWFIIALLSIFAFSIVGMASTAVDRVALYFIPIQLVVFSRLGILMAHQIKMSFVNISILGYYFLVLFVWLNFGSHTSGWLPYQNMLFLDLY